MLSVTKLQHAFTERARALGLSIECGMSGDTNAELAIIAEAPGENEVRTRVPLIGGSGSALWTIIGKHGISRERCYVTNVVKRQITISAKHNDRRDVPAAEMEQWRQLLQWELAQLPNLKYVIALGNNAAYGIGQRWGISNWRGTVEQNDEGIWQMYAENPANMMRNPEREPLFKLDMSKFALVMQGKYKEYKIEHIINPSPSEAIDWITMMHDEKKPISFDIETTGGETACIGLANNPHVGMCINFRDERTNRWSLEDEQEVRSCLQRMFSNTDLRFVAQNGNYDAGWLYFKDRMRVHKVWFDTLLAHHTLYPSLPHSLAALVSQYTFHPYYKDDGETWRERGDINQWWEYNVKDVCTTLYCQQRLEKELIAQKMDHYFFNYVMRVQPHLTSMTVHGVLCDVKKRADINTQLSADLIVLEETFHKAVKYATADSTFRPNPRSRPQMQELFFKRLGLVGRGASTNAENRDRMLSHPRTSQDAKDVIIALNSYVEQHKYYSTYINTTIDDDNRIRCEYKQYGVTKAPGRLSSAKTLWGSGMNLQNQPKRARELFIADRGHCFVYFDLSQAEARIVAWKAKIPKWQEQFERARLDGKYDCHRALASEMFKIPYDDVPKNDFDEYDKPTPRYVSKRCRHGLNYRMGPAKLASETGLSLPEAEKAYRLYHNNTPELRRWWNRTEREVRQTRELYNSFGTRLRIMGRIDEGSLDSIIAFYPQSTIGVKVWSVIFQSQEDAEWPQDSAVVMNIHDALIALAPYDSAKKCAAIMKKHAEMPINVDGVDVIIPADIAISVPDKFGVHRWSTLEKE